MMDIIKSWVSKIGGKLFADASSYEDVMNKIHNKTPNGDLDVQRIINLFLYVGGIVAVVMIIVSGIQMTTSAGDPGAVRKAKNTLTWSIIGLVIMIFAYAIVNFIIGKLPTD